MGFFQRALRRTKSRERATDATNATNATHDGASGASGGATQRDMLAQNSLRDGRDGIAQTFATRESRGSEGGHAGELTSARARRSLDYGGRRGGASISSMMRKSAAIRELAMTQSKRKLIAAALDELIEDEDEDEDGFPLSSEENGVYRALFHTVRRLVEIEQKKILSNVETDPVETLRSIENALKVANALILQIHGNAASAEAQQLLDPQAQSFVQQYVHQSQTINSLLLSRNMAKLSMEMRAPRRSMDVSSYSSGEISEFAGTSRPMSPEISHSQLSTSSAISLGHASSAVSTSWSSFDVYAFAKTCKDSRVGPLTKLTMGLLKDFGLFTSLPLSVENMGTFLSEIEAQYKYNDYHNHVHATDVTQAMAYFLDHGLKAQIEPKHVFTCLIAAVVHDVGHPGVNNHFLVDSQSEESTRWNGVSVNENGHLFRAFTGMRNHRVLDDFPPKERAEICKLMQKLVLHTDMEFHGDLVARVASDVESNTDATTHLVKPLREWNPIWVPLAFTLHCADISNPARPYHLALAWAEDVTGEFYKQGDRQRELLMDVPEFMDRTIAGPATTQSNQLGFIRFVAKPSFEVLAAIIPDAIDPLLELIDVNIHQYEQDVQNAKLSK